jgi:hypothetical protein
MTRTTDLALRIVAALLILVFGFVHIYLYFDTYRDLPQKNVGRSFVLNAIAALVVAIALVVWRHWIVLLAALVLTNATLLAFALSRTSRGIFKFTEKGWNPTPWAVLAVATEAAASVVLLVLLAFELRSERTGPAVAPA